MKHRYGALVVASIAGLLVCNTHADAQDWSEPARRQGRARGLRGLRIASWIGYGLALTDAILLIGMGVAQVEPPDGVILSVGALGGLSLGLMTADTLLAASQARKARRDESLTQARKSRTLAWAPRMSWSHAPTSSTSVAGVRGRF